MSTTDVRVPDPEHRDHNFQTSCVEGSCDCAPLCPVCGKGKCWDAKLWPGHHDWKCAHCCQADFYTLWEAKVTGKEAI